MIKRTIILVLCLMLCLLVCVFADETMDASQDSSVLQVEMPQLEEQPAGGQSLPEITMPDNGNMPDFRVPARDNMPAMPQDGENAELVEGENPQQIPEQNMEGGRGAFGGFPGMQPNNFQAEPETPKTFKEIVMEYLTPIISVMLLALAFVFVIFYKRKTY